MYACVYSYLSLAFLSSVFCLLSGTNVAKPLFDESFPRKCVRACGTSLTPIFPCNNRTVAIHFPNTTFVKVAKIEGSAAYKAFMQKPEQSCAGPSPSSPGSETTGGCCSPSSRQTYTGQRRDVDAAVGLLRALKASAESYLGTTICFADMVMPYPELIYQKTVLEGALGVLHLQQALGTLSAGKLAVISANRHHPHKSVSLATADDEELAVVVDDDDRVIIPDADADAAAEVADGVPFRRRLVLEIDYSLASLDVILLRDNGDDLFDILRHEYLPHLGARHAATPAYWDAVRRVLEEVVARPPPIAAVGRSPPRNQPPPLPPPPGESIVDQVFLFGDSASDQGFRALLATLLGEGLAAGADVFDPVFASAVGMARASFLFMDQIDFEGRPSFRCRRSSDLY